MAMRYSDKVKDHFMHPRNAGEMDDPTSMATEGSLACGDMMTFYLRVGQDERIEDAKFLSYGCAANIATGSVVTEMIKGRTLDEAERLTWEEVVEALDGLPTIKHHCSSLAIQTLRKAIRQARGEAGPDGSADGGRCCTNERGAGDDEG